MQGATTDDEPMGRNPGTSEAANLTALKVRGCDLAPRFADLIEASGHVPCFKAVHMNAPSTRVKSIEKLLAPRAVPHMRLARRSLALRPAHSRRHLYVTRYTEGFSHFVTSMTAPVASGWSGRRVGLAPTGKRRLLTTHANSGHSGRLAEQVASTLSTHSPSARNGRKAAE